MSNPSNASTIGSSSQISAVASSPLTSAPQPPTNVITYSYSSQLVRVAPAEAYDDAIDIAKESFRELKDVERERISFQIKLKLDKSQLSRTTEIGRTAWPMVIASLARFEIVEIRVAPVAIEGHTGVALFNPQASAVESLAKQQSVSIHILDDHSLLNIFYLYRPYLFGEDEEDLHNLRGDKGRWWYRLAHVCQRWRNLILGSTSYLRLSLVCTNGTPIEDMLAHSPSLPLTVHYFIEDGVTAEDESGMLLALEQRHRVRHIFLIVPVQKLQKIVMAIDGEFPILEYLAMGPTLNGNTTLVLPETLQAPNLRHLTLGGFACPIRSRLHPTAASLVALFLVHHPSAHFQPDVLVRSVSFMPQLEIFAIFFSSLDPDHDVEWQLIHAPVTTIITLPNLRSFSFRGMNAYFEAIVCRVTAPRLEQLRIQLFEPRTFSVPRLARFIDTTENLTFDVAVLKFNEMEIAVGMFSDDSDKRRLAVRVDCCHPNCQAYIASQLSSALSQLFSALECLTLVHGVHGQSSEEYNDVDRIEWRNLLRWFSNVKILRVEDGLIEELSHCLRPEDGELPLELLPELQELRYLASRDTGDAFASFIHARHSAGRPVALIHHKPMPTPKASSDDLSITTADGESGNDTDA